jgi:hypothetical protein
LTLIAEAADPDGAVFKVEFYTNNTRLGEDTTPSPFSFTWPSPPAGNHTLRAIATDDSGLIRTSAPVSISVLAGFTTNITLINTGAIWRYLDNGSDQGTTWTSSAFNDSGWSSGPAELGYGDSGEGRPEATVVGFGPNAGAKYITTYFRRTFNVANPASFSSLNLRVLRDDGVVVYLNGSEVFRNNMPVGAIGYLTTTPANIGGADEYTFLTADVNPGYLVPGLNVVAVEIHQSSGSSGDLSFDLQLTGVQSYIAPYFIAQPQSRTNSVGTDSTFTATVGGSAPMTYQWRFEGTNIIGATNPAFIRNAVQPAHAGSYLLVATNSAGSATSTVAVLTVTNPDSDGDGMPNWWEAIYGLNENLNDANLDLDTDGMTNLDEFHAGTNPTNPQSVLRLRWMSLGPNRLEFVAQSNISYSIQYSTNLGQPQWFTLSNIAPLSLLRTAIVTDPSPTNRARFYRATTP